MHSACPFLIKLHQQNLLFLMLKFLGLQRSNVGRNVVPTRCSGKAAKCLFRFSFIQVIVI